jgi:hypothetical protein
MTKRRRFKHTASFQERLEVFVKDALERAQGLVPGQEKDNLLRKVRQADTALHLDDWANSPGLQPPK